MIGWINAWNTIIRRVIWPDQELKSLMKLPSKTGILQFRDKYFIRAGYSNTLLTDEVCRIVYADSPGSELNVPNITRNLMTFDIYVKQNEMYNVSDDRLVSRSELIAARLRTLLARNRFVADTGYKFEIAGDWDMGTRVTGYARYTIAFRYKKVY